MSVLNSIKEMDLSTIKVEVLECIDNIGQMQTFWSLVVSCLLFGCFLWCVVKFRKNVCQQSLTQIQEFQKVKKYEPALYIELNENLENLRFFIMEHKWKHRVIREYNQLFTGFIGRKMLRELDGNYNGKLNCFSRIGTIQSSLADLHTCFATIRADRRTGDGKHGEFFYIMQNLSGDYIATIKRLQQTCDMIESKAMILIGSAGNGKTTMMCRTAEMAIANKTPILFINARDIDRDCVEYISDKLPLPKRFRQFTFFYLFLISKLLWFQRKHFYIMIDAINENDREVFVGSIGKAVEYFSKFSKVRILLSCRSEYFEARCERYFDNCSVELLQYNLMENQYLDRATKKMFEKYKEYFNVTGAISPYAKSRLLKSLFLMRMFFEVNEGKTGNTLELRNAQIYLKYVEKVNAEVRPFDFMGLINKTAKIMLTNGIYDSVNISDFELSSEDGQNLLCVLDENLIISRNIQKGTGITARDEELVFFVFDELRDFCLARYLLVCAEDAQDENYFDFFGKVSELFKTRQSPTEGIIRYAYDYFKHSGKHALSEKILTLYGEVDIQRIAYKEKRGYHQTHAFDQFYLSLIFANGFDILEFEIQYLKNQIHQNPYVYNELFWFLFSNEYVNISPRLDVGLRLLFEDTNYAEIKGILKEFFVENYYTGHKYPEKRSKVTTILDWVEHIEHRNGSISIELKQFLVLLSVYKPYEQNLRRYHKYSLDATICDSLCDKISDEDFLLDIQNLQERCKKKYPIFY